MPTSELVPMREASAGPPPAAWLGWLAADRAHQILGVVFCPQRGFCRAGRRAGSKAPSLMRVCARGNRVLSDDRFALGGGGGLKH